MEKLQLDIPLNSEVLQLSKIIKLYVVGGLVRDALFNHFHQEKFDPKDIDLATHLNPDEVISELNKHKDELRVNILEIGKSFGVIAVVFPNGNKYEIATFREEWYDEETGDGRRPDFVKYSTPENDALRRDLTINSLFYSISDRTVLDYVGTGIEDVKNRIIRPVGDPYKRFHEDRLRVMRIIRFFCRYQNNFIRDVMDENVIEAIISWKDMPGVSCERIVEEFVAGLKQTRSVPNYLLSLCTLKIMPRIFWGLEVRTQDAVSIGSRNPKIVLALLFNEEAVDVAYRLGLSKWDNKTIQTVMFLRNFFMDTLDGYQFWKKREQLISKDLSSEEQNEARRELQEWSEYVCLVKGLNLPLARKKMNWNPSVSAKDFPDLQGKELGEAIKNAINKEYEQLEVI